MARFKKPSLSVGSYLASQSGGRQSASFDKSRLQKMCDTSNAMIKAGLKIPAPFEHSPQAVPVTDKPSDAFKNGGYWTKFWMLDDPKHGPTLYGELEAPGDVNDESTSAGKIGKTVQECSLSTKKEFVDGSGHAWEEPIMHVALVTHPVDF